MSIVATIYPAGEEATYHDAITEVEQDGCEISLHLDVGTEDVVTATLSIEAAWTLIRDLSRAVRDAELADA